MQPRTNKNLDIKVLETWINETLREAEAFDINGCIQRVRAGEGSANGGKQTKCIEYGIDRLTLGNTGISNASIDKMYRSLFVTTMGFYSQLNELIEQAADTLKVREGVATTLKNKSA